MKKVTAVIDDPEVLKAYNTGITAGVSSDRFAPGDLLNREQAATMLTRVFKKAFVDGSGLGSSATPWPMSLTASRPTNWCWTTWLKSSAK